MGRNVRIPGPLSTKAPAHTAILYLSLLISKSDVILVFICFFNEATSIIQHTKHYRNYYPSPINDWAAGKLITEQTFV